MKKKTLPCSRRENIVMQEFNDEILIYDLNTNKAVSLNKTAAMIWQECDGAKDVSEINRIINRKLKIKADENLIWLAIGEFKKENLLAENEQVVPDFNGLSRREVIKKVGLGSMVALPLVSSIVAPTAAMAQSGICAQLEESCFQPGVGFIPCCDRVNNPNVDCCGIGDFAVCFDAVLGGGDCGVTGQ